MRHRRGRGDLESRNRKRQTGSRMVGGEGVVEEGERERLNQEEGGDERWRAWSKAEKEERNQKGGGEGKVNRWRGCSRYRVHIIVRKKRD